MKQKPKNLPLYKQSTLYKNVVDLLEIEQMGEEDRSDEHNREYQRIYHLLPNLVSRDELIEYTSELIRSVEESNANLGERIRGIFQRKNNRMNAQLQKANLDAEELRRNLVEFIGGNCSPGALAELERILS